MPASTVKVTMPGQAATVSVKYNASTRHILRRLSRTGNVYMVRSEADAGALSQHIVGRQGS
ncbi:MAG TPA: hypothetical protein VGB98_25715 [Pyrinomonadaceae bacterium]|jgi:hypothetical protein